MTSAASPTDAMPRCWALRTQQQDGDAENHARRR